MSTQFLLFSPPLLRKTGLSVVDEPSSRLGGWWQLVVFPAKYQGRMEVTQANFVFLPPTRLD